MHIKKFLYGALSVTLALAPVTPILATTNTTVTTETKIASEETMITLADSAILVDGEVVSTDTSEAVYTSHDIIYYEDKDTYESGNVYGEGTEEDKHSAEEASKHTVVNITKPGTYRISGQLSYGQIFVNVGEEETDKVTLILDNVDINCTVAPAVFFYNVYECDSEASTETATNVVDTSQAGAKVIVADDSINNVKGSYVARIYKDNGEEKKLHKYDGAFYSRMSMEIDGETKGNGKLNIVSDNEGLDTELHLTINGGHIHIESCDDGININEDGVSVLTINGGSLNIDAGNGSEGDGIDSNGWIVINDGHITALSNPRSADGGIDSDMGVTINGGTVMGAGNMYDPVEESSSQLFMYMQFAQKANDLIVITDAKDNPIFAYDFSNSYQNMVVSLPELKEGTYHVYQGGTITGEVEHGLYTKITSYVKGTQLHHGGMSTMPNMGQFGQGGNVEGLEIPEGMEFGERPEMPEGMGASEMPQMPEGMEFRERPEMLEGMEAGEMPQMPNGMGRPGMTSSSKTVSYDFVVSQTNRGFSNVSSSTESTTGTNNTTGGKVSSFIDVKNNSWYAQAVAFCNEKGLMGGTSETNFSPDERVTREMFATILYRLAGSPEVVTSSAFSDVSNKSAYYYNAVSWAAQSGVTKGISKDTFGVGKSITVQDAITMLERYGKAGDLTNIENVSATSKAPATRAQIAALLMAYCK